VFDACRTITRASGRGLGPGNRGFFEPKKVGMQFLRKKTFFTENWNYKFGLCKGGWGGVVRPLHIFPSDSALSDFPPRTPLPLHTDTKLKGLFRAPARMSVIKLFLARNTISFCGLKKLFAIARSSPGIFENLYCVHVPRP
jgi:hypothetical protein